MGIWEGLGKIIGEEDMWVRRGTRYLRELTKIR
jgi:hypothetical protein